MENNKYQMYDAINTTAVRWLTSFADKHEAALCIKDFDIKNKHHLWLLEMLKSYSIFNNYCSYYIQSNIFIYLYLRIFKRFKHIRLYSKSKKMSFIDPAIFVEELTNCYEENPYIINAIYNAYYA